MEPRLKIMPISRKDLKRILTEVKQCYVERDGELRDALDLTPSELEDMIELLTSDSDQEIT